MLSTLGTICCQKKTSPRHTEGELRVSTGNAKLHSTARPPERDWNARSQMTGTTEVPIDAGGVRRPGGASIGLASCVIDPHKHRRCLHESGRVSGLKHRIVIKHSVNA